MRSVPPANSRQHKQRDKLIVCQRYLVVGDRLREIEHDNRALVHVAALRVLLGSKRSESSESKEKLGESE